MDGFQLYYKLELYHKYDINTGLTDIIIKNKTDQDILKTSINLLGVSFYIKIHKDLDGMEICGSHRDSGITFGTGEKVTNQKCFNMSSYFNTSRNSRTLKEVLLYQDALLRLGIIEYHKDEKMIEWYQTSSIPEKDIFFLSNLKIPPVEQRSPTKIVSLNEVNVIVAKCLDKDASMIYFNLTSFTYFLGKNYYIHVNDTCNFIKESGIYQLKGLDGTVLRYAPIYVNKWRLNIKTQLILRLNVNFGITNTNNTTTISIFERHFVNFAQIYAMGEWKLDAFGIFTIEMKRKPDNDTECSYEILDLRDGNIHIYESVKLKLKWRQVNINTEMTDLDRLNKTYTFFNALLLQVKCPNHDGEQNPFNYNNNGNFRVFTKIAECQKIL